MHCSPDIQPRVVYFKNNNIIFKQIIFIEPVRACEMIIFLVQAYGFAALLYFHDVRCLKSGTQPYPMVPGSKAENRIKAGEKMDCPEDCPPEV